MRTETSRLPFAARWRVALGSLTMTGGLLVGSSALAAPDLTVQLLRRTSGPVFTGATIEYIVNVHNAGDAAAVHAGDAAAAHTFVQTTLPPSWSFVTPGEPECFFGVTSVPRPFGPPATAERALCGAGVVPAGKTKSFILRVKVPTVLRQWPFIRAVDSQNFTLTADVDPDGLVQESNEDNNRATIETTVETAAELVPDWTGPITVPFGANHIYHARVRNVGDRDAADVTVNIVIPGLMDIDNFGGGNLQCSGPSVDANSGNPQLSCFATLLPAGGESATTLTVHVNRLVSDRSHAQLVIIADPGGTVPERDKGNNFAPLMLTIRAPADLQLSGEISVADDWTIPPPFLPPSADPFIGKSLANLTLQVHNAGPASSPATTLNVDWASVFSDLDSLCPGGTFFDFNSSSCLPGPRQPPLCFRTASVPSLEPGATIEILCRAIKPFNPFSLSHLVEWGSVTLDPDNVVFDPNRNNNHMPIPN